MNDINFKEGELLYPTCPITGWIYEPGKEPTNGSIEALVKEWDERFIISGFEKVLVSGKTPLIFIGNHTKVYDNVSSL